MTHSRPIRAALALAIAAVLALLSALGDELPSNARPAAQEMRP